MGTALVEHAKQYAWCNPELDGQYIIIPARISPDHGVLGAISLMGRDLSLPTSGKRYHVYNIGQVYETVFGIPAYRKEMEVERWVRFDELVGDRDMFVNIYNTDGICLPLSKAYYSYTSERTLVVAIEIVAKIPFDFLKDDLTIRLYRNPFFEIVGRSDTEFISAHGVEITGTEDINSIVSEINGLKARHGHLWAWHNGQRVTQVSVTNLSVGDVVDYIYDSTVKRVITASIKGLATFQSTLDSRQKYIIHYQSDDITTVDFCENIDIDVIYPEREGYGRGRYLNNVRGTTRMLTHRDYSVNADEIRRLGNSIIDVNKIPSASADNVYLEIKIRETGDNKKLLIQSNLINELYKLPEHLIMEAFQGVNANLQQWRAAELEMSAQSILYGLLDDDITDAIVDKAYGYNGAKKMLLPEPFKLSKESSVYRFKVPTHLKAKKATVFEYDEDGILLGYRVTNNSDYYVADHPLARMIEIVPGQGTNAPWCYFHDREVYLEGNNNFRVYLCFKKDGIPNEEWRDITDTDMYTVKDGYVTWAGDQIGQYLMVRSDSTFTIQDIEVTPVSGTVFFKLAEVIDRGDGPLPYVSRFPAGRLDVIVNGHRLVRDVGFIVNFPDVYIIDKSVLRQPASTTPQSIIARSVGFPDVNLDYYPPADRGYIEHGVLSNNGKFNIRDDKVLSIFVDGKLKTRDEVVFSEDVPGIPDPTNPLNGRPYEVYDNHMNIKPFVSRDPQVMRKEGEDREALVSAYMTEKIPQPDRGFYTIRGKIQVISPFLCRILNDLVDGKFDSDLVEYVETMSRIEVKRMCSKYEYLLDFDPIGPMSEVDQRFTEVVPHQLYSVIDLPYRQFVFYKTVVGIYADKLVDISTHVSLSTRS